MEDERERIGIRINFNDFILILSVFYSIADIFIQWKSFSKCYKPIQLWLVISFISIVLFRLSHFLAQYLSNENENFIIYRRNNPPTFINFLVLCILFPFFIIWNIIGTIWIYKVIKYTPNCLPSNNHPWFIVLWIILCYIWIFLYLFFIILSIYLEYQSRIYEGFTNTEANGLFSRWSDNIDLIRDYGIFICRKGLRLKQIENLPYYYLKNIAYETKCSICLNDFQIEDCVRTLLLCNHTFHKSCIDLWLIRSATCPNCKSSIATQGIFTDI